MVVSVVDELALAAGTVIEVHGILGKAESLIDYSSTIIHTKPSASPPSKDAGDLNRR